MAKKKRIAAVLLAAIILFVMLSSACYIAIEANHDCIGESCPVCEQILACENAQRFVGQAVLVVILAACMPVIAVSLSLFMGKPTCSISLITLKVKLSN